MSSARPLESVSITDYLDGERTAKRKHEFVCGTIYAQAGASSTHNLIAMNFYVALGAQLRGRKCRVYGADTKVRIRESLRTRFYYPDGMVVCESNPPADHFQDKPVVLFEVLSPSTRRIDEGEKREAYERIPSLETYVLLEQHCVAAVAYQRGDQGFERSVYTGADAKISLPAIDCTLALSEIYEAVEFVPEPSEDDDTF